MADDDQNFDAGDSEEEFNCEYNDQVSGLGKD